MRPPLTPAQSSRFCFGAFELESKGRELRKEGVRIRLQDQPIRILLILLERPGELVTREELRDRIWSAETFVEFEHSLNTAVNKLRRALNDSADHPRYIETVPRRGYRFIGELQTDTPCAEARAPAAKARSRTWVWLLAALSMIAIGAGTAWRWPRTAPVNLPQTVPLTSYPGAEVHPSFSPDGNQIAFGWNGPNEDNTDVYVKVVGSGDPLRLTTSPETEDVPTWSPDGRWIAFVRRHATLRQGGVYVVSPLGGDERKVGETTFHDFKIGPTLAWTPDSKWIAIRDDATLTRPRGLYVLSPQTGETKLMLASPPGNTFPDFGAAFSGDGTRLAFSRDAALHVVALDGLQAKGEPKRLTQATNALEGSPVWSSSQQDIFFVRSMGLNASTLWRIPAQGEGQEAQVPNLGSTDISQPALAGSAGRLAFTVWSYHSDIWRIPLREDHVSAAAPKRIIASSRFNGTMAISPQGDRIAFCSARSGMVQIWVSTSDGTNPSQVTHHPGGLVGIPTWSPDGRLIAYDAVVDGKKDVYVIPAGGGFSRRLTDHDSDMMPAWSADGKWIYYSSNKGGSRHIWKKPFQGGEAIRVTRDKGIAARESPDSRYLCYFSQDPDMLWIMPLRNGLPDENGKRLVSESASFLRFSVSNSGIYFAKQGRLVNIFQATATEAIYFHDFATGRTRTVLEASNPLSLGVAVSPDESWLLYSQVESAGADLMLVEHFR